MLGVVPKILQQYHNQFTEIYLKMLKSLLPFLSYSCFRTTQLAELMDGN